MPFVRPEITIGEFNVGATIHVAPPSIEYSLRITLRPPALPAVNSTESPPFDEFTAVIVGTSGTPAGITVNVADSRPAPARFTARIATS